MFGRITVSQIDKDEFFRLSNLDSIYFVNGCLFDRFDNLVAFPFYYYETEEPVFYCKVVCDVREKI